MFAMLELKMVDFVFPLIIFLFSLILDLGLEYSVMVMLCHISVTHVIS